MSISQLIDSKEYVFGCAGRAAEMAAPKKKSGKLPHSK
jgi:hypothetical protein